MNSKKIILVAPIAAMVLASGCAYTPTLPVEGNPTVASAKPTEKAKPKLTVAQTQAVKAAKSYLESGHFSKLTLTQQLTSEYGEGFSKADAEFAVKYVKPDWNAEAREAARSYLESGHFSHKGLMEQLTSEYGEGFTQAQAAQAVKSVGL